MLVNGVPVIDQGKMTGSAAGKSAARRWLSEIVGSSVVIAAQVLLLRNRDLVQSDGRRVNPIRQSKPANHSDPGYPRL